MMMIKQDSMILLDMAMLMSFDVDDDRSMNVAMVVEHNQQHSLIYVQHLVHHVLCLLVELLLLLLLLLVVVVLFSYVHDLDDSLTLLLKQIVCDMMIRDKKLIEFQNLLYY